MGMPHSGPGLETPSHPLRRWGGDRAGPPLPSCLGRGSGTAGREDPRNEGCRQRTDDCSGLTKASSAFPPPRGASPLTKIMMFMQQEPLLSLALVAEGVAQGAMASKPEGRQRSHKRAEGRKR